MVRFCRAQLIFAPKRDFATVTDFTTFQALLFWTSFLVQNSLKKVIKVINLINW